MKYSVAFIKLDIFYKGEMNLKNKLQKNTVFASKHYDNVQSLHLHREIHRVLYYDHIAFAYLMKNPAENF